MKETPEYLSKDKHPVIKRMAELIDVMQQRGAKYTDSSWRDNFDYVSTASKRYGLELSPAEVALVLAMVKEARISASTNSGRKDFEDDMLEDSYNDLVNYLLFYRVIKAQDEA